MKRFNADLVGFGEEVRGGAKREEINRRGGEGGGG